jgi:hypothetical protein
MVKDHYVAPSNGVANPHPPLVTTKFLNQPTSLDAASNMTDTAINALEAAMNKSFTGADLAARQA